MPQRPKLGQNLLVSPTAQTAIADALGDVSRRTVVEIGPGRGAITAILAVRARRLVAIELDRNFAAGLREQFANWLSVEILEQNVLAADFAALRGAEEEKLLIVGNLPYYITSDILLHLFAAAVEGKLRRAVLMMQREVGERVAASPGVRDYGLLSATTQMYAEVEHLFTLPPSAFNPPPDVFSSVLRLHFAPRFAELGVDARGFDAFLKQAFAQKRKTLTNNLKFAGYEMSALERGWPKNLPRQARAEEISLPAMAELYRGLRG